MKSYLKIYLKFALFILITFTITSLIMAGIISFIHLSNFIYHSIEDINLINILSRPIILIITTLILQLYTKKLDA